MDYTVHGILQARILEWVAFPFSREFSHPRSPILQADSLPAEPQRKPKNTGMGSLSLSSGSSQPRNWTGVSLIADEFFTNWAIREAQSCINDPLNHPAKVHILYVSGSQCFWHQELISWRQFFHGPGEGGVVSGWFRNVTFTVHFISNLMLVLIWQEIPMQAQRLGTPCCICSNTSLDTPWSLMLYDLPLCIQYKSNLFAHRFAPGGLWLKNIETCYLFAKKLYMSFHWNRGICLYLVSVCLTLGRFMCFDGFSSLGHKMLHSTRLKKFLYILF